MAAEMYKEEWNRRAEERKLFRHKNLNVSREEFEKRIRGKKLDSNLKKCTAFIRKLVKKLRILYFKTTEK